MMKVLFIGGTGIISSACSELAIELGYDLYLLNRGQSSRPAHPGAKVLQANYHDPSSMQGTLGDHTFDAVVQWIVFTPGQIESDLQLFRGRTGQYVFISTASAYQKPPARLPVTESTPLYNPYWEYSRNKIACEDRLVQAYRADGFPATIVRPSHTYDRTLLPFFGGYTSLWRMRQGKPVVVHGDGTSLWTMTHHQDFARGFVPLLGNPHVIGEAFHITSDEWLSWNQIYQIVARAGGVQEPAIIHIPSDFIAKFDPDWGAGLLGDKAHSMIFDNAKIKRVVPGFEAVIPFYQGAREIVGWYDADPARQQINPAEDARIERVIQAYQHSENE